VKVLRTLSSLALALGFFGPLACRREEKPTAPAPPPPKPELAPWSWHALGGLLVIEGEVDAPTELTLKGRYLDERRFVDLGPVRWELYRPPPGAKAELRTSEGKLLATWDFDQPPPVPQPPALKAPKPASPKPEPHRPEARRPEPKRPEPKKPEPKKAEPKKPEPKKPEPKKPEPKKPEPKRPAPISPERPKPQPRKPEPQRPQLPSPEAPKPKPRPLTVPAPEPLPIPPAPRQGTGPAWPGSREGFNLIRGPRGQRQVCLTFDGGSTAEVAQDVLDALKERRLHCTFFLTGAFIQKFPEIVRRIDQDGHEIGNHTLDHPHFAPTGLRDPKWTKERFQEELLAADRALQSLLGRPMDPLWRAPYGEHTSELRKWAEELGYRHVGWSEGADTLDWATVKERKLYRTGNAILDRLRTRMERQDGEGLIVLMHLGSARPAEDRPARVLGPFLDKALTDGWRFVFASSYLQAAGKPAWERNRRAALLVSGTSSRASGARR
jgi:peptidoglycan/xylan/chitin deacetylase (PgdA/CDA1 family)